MGLVVCIPTAGTGSRLGDLTRNLNKSLLSVDNKPVLSHVIEKYPKDTNFVIPIGFASDLIKQYIGMAHPNANVIFVDVDLFEGEGSGLGYSLLKCRDYLNKPFIFHSCDTIVLESIPNIENNWVGLSKNQPTHEFRRVRVNEQAVIEFIDKDSEITAEQFTYIGLAGVNDHQNFWESMKSGGVEAVNLGEVYGLISLIDKSITTFNFTWFDIGSRNGLDTARNNIQSTFTPNILDKEDEAIWFIGERVIKFSTDSSFIKNRVQRAKAIANYVPQITFATQNMYSYTKVEGQVLSSIITQPVFKNFLTYLEGFFDQAIESTLSSKEFNAKCYEFYHDKTLERVEQYLTKFNLTDGAVYINGRGIRPIFNQLENLDWESISNGVPSNFHGDLHFENILVQQNESFKFLDWRQNFAGCLDLGDRYYDLAKLLHGMIVPHQSVHDEQYSLSIDNQNIAIDIRTPREYELIRRLYWEWLTINNYNVGKVYSLTALVFLNIAALHHEPYCHFLYYLGRYMLDKGIDENYEGTLPNVYLNVSHYIKDQKLLGACIVPQIETIERNKCAISGMEDLEVIDVMPRFPIYMGCVDTPETDDVFVDAIWSISKSSGVIQLQRLIPLNLLYQENHASGVVGDIWMQHHCAFADFLQQQKPLSVFEIGGAHGILATEYMKQQTIEWVILEPNPAPIEGCPAKFVRGFFAGKEDIPVGKPTIVHSHVFEHIYDPRGFVQCLAESMDVGQEMVFSIPNMLEMLRRGYTNCLNFEHSVFLTEDAIDGLLSEFGLVIKEKKLFRQDHSIFYSVYKSKEIEPIADRNNHYERNLEIYSKYKDRYKDLIAKFNIVLTDAQTDKKVFLFGAHIFSQYLIFNGLDVSQIHCILDNDVNKQNHRMYGTQFLVESPTVLAEVDKPIVVLCAGVYNEEIKRSIFENINSSTIFLEDV